MGRAGGGGRGGGGFSGGGRSFGGFSGGGRSSGGFSGGMTVRVRGNPQPKPPIGAGGLLAGRGE